MRPRLPGSAIRGSVLPSKANLVDLLGGRVRRQCLVQSRCPALARRVPRADAGGAIA